MMMHVWSFPTFALKFCASQAAHLQHLIFFKYTGSVESEVASPISLMASWVSTSRR